MKRPHYDVASPQATAEVPTVADLVEDVAVAGRPWLGIDDAPRDGTLIQVGPSTFARYRITRRRDTENRRWEKVGFWADPITREPLTEEPTRYRLPEGYLTPGLVVA